MYILECLIFIVINSILISLSYLWPNISTHAQQLKQEICLWPLRWVVTAFVAHYLTRYVNYYSPVFHFILNSLKEL